MISVKEEIFRENSLSRLFKLYLELAKFRITFFVSLSTAVGYILFAGKLNAHLFIISLGVLSLAGGSSALNHFQERKTDFLMNRTKMRPIPSGDISAENAFLFGILLIFFGAALLFLFANTLALMLGFLAVLWYNIIYTPLKRINAFAIIPGSIIGAIPPVIGYVSAGGTITDPAVISLAGFFFIWQIPHFWLLLILYSDDYLKAGFPTLTKIFSEKQLSRITFIWIFTLTISGLMIPFWGRNFNLITVFFLLFLGIWIIYFSKPLLAQPNKIRIKRIFLGINLYVLFAIIVISLDKLIFSII